MRNLAKILLVNTLVILFGIITFDVMMFNFLPGHYAGKFPQYRIEQGPMVGGHGKYPNGYFVKHEKRGFDIGENKHGYHWTNGVTYPIWSNSFGCFDNEQAASGEYIYFAGDSFTWGYTPFDQKFGTVVEQETGARIFKCGVTHTGQVHQFDKFAEIVERTGNKPEAVFVFYVSNDVANDYAHPHSTVIKGWLVNSVSLDEDDKPIEYSRQELVQRIEHSLGELQLKKQEEQQAGWWTRGVDSLKYYSLTANILQYVFDHSMLYAGLSNLQVRNNTGEAYRSIYHLPQEKNDRFWYKNNQIAQRNKSALLDFSRYSNENNIKFVVVILPMKRAVSTGNRDWYAELREFLVQHNIEHVDLGQKFIDQGLASKDLYWPLDGHLSPSGNRIVAEALMQEFPQIFRDHQTSE